MSRVLSMASESFGLTEREMSKIILSAPYRYKVFEIKKRKKGELRTVAQPAKEIKILQKWLVKNVIGNLPIHDAATAYLSDRGIKYNAQQHVRNSYLLKMDFRKFFPSIKSDALTRHILKYLPGHYDEEDISLICSIALWQPRGKKTRELCIGGPSSPFISNSIVYDFDVLIYQQCQAMNVTYTRYADDLAFSTNEPNVLREIEAIVTHICSEIEYPDLVVNASKTVHSSKMHRRFVTGITLSSAGQISLGRERKRKIRVMIHKAILKELSNKEMANLRGLLAFAHDIEPVFVESMRLKYGDEIIKALQKWERN